MARIRTNLTRTTLTEAISDTDTTFTVAAVPEILNVLSADYAAFAIEDEIVHLVDYNGTTNEVTVVRGREGTTAAAHDSGKAFANVLTAADMGILRLNGSEPLPYWVTSCPPQDWHVNTTSTTALGPYAAEIGTGGDDVSVYTDSAAHTPWGTNSMVAEFTGTYATNEYSGILYRSDDVLSRTLQGMPTPPPFTTFQARVRYKATTDANATVRFYPNPNLSSPTAIADSTDYAWTEWMDIDPDDESWAFAFVLFATGATTTSTLTISGMQVRQDAVGDPIPDARAGSWYFALDPEYGSGAWTGSVEVFEESWAECLGLPYTAVSGLTDNMTFPYFDPTYNHQSMWSVQVENEGPLCAAGYRGLYSIAVEGDLTVGVEGATVMTEMSESPSASHVVFPQWAQWQNILPGFSGWHVYLGLSPATVSMSRTGAVYAAFGAEWDTGTAPEFDYLGIGVTKHRHTDPHVFVPPPPVTADVALTSPVSGQISWDLDTINVGTKVRIEVFDDSRSMVDFTETTNTTGSFTSLSAGPHLVVVTGLIDAPSEGYTDRRRFTSASSTCNTVMVT